MHRNGMMFATASEDQTCRLYDVRAHLEINCYTAVHRATKFAGCCVSVSGRILMAAAEDTTVHLWDTLKSKHAGKQKILCMIAG